MATPVQIIPSNNSVVSVGGTSVVAILGGVLGGAIANPATSTEPLYFDMTAPATTAESATTFVLQPGDSFILPGAMTNPTWVNAKTKGHIFSSFTVQNPTQFPPTLLPQSFPPAVSPTLSALIPSYLYQEYSDDDTLQEFVASFNQFAQDYIDTFNALNLPIYTAQIISGLLLDWVAQGIYGMSRPTLSSGKRRTYGPFGTEMFGALLFGSLKHSGPSNITVTNDDFFKRILTWHFFKGDGKTFNVQWLKRRVMRFLIGVNGSAPHIDYTPQISVTFGPGNEATIAIIEATFKVTSSSAFGGLLFGSNKSALFGHQALTVMPLPFVPNAVIFQEAVNTGALELPFQYFWNTEIIST